MIANNITELRRIGIRWAVLSCLHETLCNCHGEVPRFIRRELEVARCIIETSCREISEAERILERIERNLIKMADAERAENVAFTVNLLRKTRNELPEAREVLEIPRIKGLIQSYEFLSYFVYHSY